MQKYPSKKDRMKEFIRNGLNVGKTRAQIVRDIQLRFDDPPARATVYAWAAEASSARTDDRSGMWVLANDESGRPDVVLRVLAALRGQAGPGHHEVSVSVDEARWLARLANAMPELLEDRISASKMDSHPVWGPLRALDAAQQYLALERQGDLDRLHDLDTSLAVYNVNGGRHLDEATRDESENLGDVYRNYPYLWPDDLRDAPREE